MLLTLVLVPNLKPTTFRPVFVPKVLEASTLVATGERTTRNPPLHAADSQTLTCGLVFYSCRHSTTLVEKRIKTNCVQWKVSLFSLADLTPCDTHKVLFGVGAVMSHHSEKSLICSILNGVLWSSHDYFADCLRVVVVYSLQCTFSSWCCCSFSLLQSTVNL